MAYRVPDDAAVVLGLDQDVVRLPRGAGYGDGVAFAGLSRVNSRDRNLAELRNVHWID